MLRYALTAAIVLAAIAAAGWKYVDYLTNPWTRDGQVRAQVIQIAPRVTGPVVELAVVDNQAVSAGDLLFRIDPRTFDAALAQAEADLTLTRNQITSLTEEVNLKRAAVGQIDQQIEQSEADVEAAEANVFQVDRNLQRIRTLVERGDLAATRLDEQTAADRQARAQVRAARAVSAQFQAARLQAQADLARAQADLGVAGDDNARLKAATATLEQARLNREFAEVRAPVDGFVTNLKLRLGSQAVANQPVLALVDRNSFWVDAYFRETLIAEVGAGDAALVTLMSHPDTPLRGQVQSIGWGIATGEGSTGEDLLPKVSPSFPWIRLAQRVPVRVELDPPPDGVALRVGSTASVLVMTDGQNASVSAPSLLQ